MLAVLLTAMLGCQEPVPASGSRPAQPPQPAVTWNDAEAKAAVIAYQNATKGRVSLADKIKALEELGRGSHRSLVKPLASVVQAEKSLTVRRRAAELLANQPPEHAGPAIHRLLKTPVIHDQPEVFADLLRGFTRTGYEAKHWRDIDGVFQRQYGAERVVLQEAVLELVIAHKEKQALDLLLENMDEPIPANVDDPSNPPAEYWEARWKAWRVWRGKVKDALHAVTGQRFSTSQEAKAWLRKNPIK